MIIVLIFTVFLLFKIYIDWKGWKLSRHQPALSLAASSTEAKDAPKYGGPFRNEIGKLETSVLSCKTALQTVLKGIETLESRAYSVRKEEYAKCKLQVGEALNEYKKAFRIATGSDLTNAQLEKLKKDNSIDF